MADTSLPELHDRSAKFNFLSLPTEIRLRIYHHLYSREPSYLILHLEHGKRRIYEVPTHRGILLACRRCYYEAITLNRESLTHLYVDCDRFSIFQPTVQREDTGEHYDRMFGDLFWSVPLDSHTRQLLSGIRKLTLPAFISGYSIINAVERGILAALNTIEFVSHERPILDHYPATPLHKSDQEYNDLSGSGANGRPSRWIDTKNFEPIRHLSHSLHNWEEVNILRCEARKTLPGGQFRVLWTSAARWTRRWVELDDEPKSEYEPLIVVRSPDVRPLCQLVEFVSGFISFRRQLTSLSTARNLSC